jgi:serine/threonine protein kinase
MHPFLHCSAFVSPFIPPRDGNYASVRNEPTSGEIRNHQFLFYRDIKPDNILLDERGNAHLTDFNIAVHFGERKLTGVAGSMAYMAPEYVLNNLMTKSPFRSFSPSRILLKRGYTYCIDWWSLGVCAYELIFGRRPFRGRTNNDLTYSISKDPVKWPEDAESRCTRAGMQVIRGVSPESGPKVSSSVVNHFVCKVS